MICCYTGHKKEFIYVSVVSVNSRPLNVNYAYTDTDVLEICIL